MTDARHLADSPEWYTPAPIVTAARAVMGGIDLDPASHPEANDVVQATTIYTAELSGLMQAWDGRVLCNPPTGLVNAFWEKLTLEVDGGRVPQAIWVGYSLEQLQTLQRTEAARSPLAYPICVPRQRLLFDENRARAAERRAKLIRVGQAAGASRSARQIAAHLLAGGEVPNRPSHANFIAYLGPCVAAFVDVFGAIGACTVPR